MEPTPTAPSSPVQRILESLPSRKQEVLLRLSGGYSDVEIASQLHLAPSTVRTYVKQLQAVFGVHTRAQLVVVAYETGLVSPGSHSTILDAADGLTSEVRPP